MLFFGRSRHIERLATSFRWLEQKPLRSMGLVANLLITLVYLVMPILR